MQVELPMGDQIVINANKVLIEGRKKDFERKFQEAKRKESADLDESAFNIDAEEAKANLTIFDSVDYNRRRMLEEHHRRFYLPQPIFPIQPVL